MKILFEGLSENVGGIETFTYNLCKYLIKNGHEISFLVDSNLKIAYQGEYEKEGCKIFRTENRKNSYKKYLNDLKKIYLENDFDIIHINVMSYTLFERILYAYKYSKGKVIVHSHNSGYKKGYYRTRFLHIIGSLFLNKKRFYKIACGELAGKYMFKNDDFIVINNGIDTDKFCYSEENREEIRNEFKIEKDTKVILDVAKLSRVKNHIFLLEIFVEYLKLNKSAILMLVGDGELKNEIEGRVKELGIDKNVIFTGKRTDTYKIYSASDVYVIPSTSEGLNISVCEAQINGLKCYMSTNVDRNSDISGNLKFLSFDEGAKKWAEKIYNDDKRDYDVLKKIPDGFKLESTNNKVLKYYNDILKEK